MIEDTDHSTLDAGDASDVSQRSTHQLVESNVAALGYMSHECQSVVRERVVRWLESSSESSMDGEDRKKMSFTDRLFQRIAFTSSEAKTAYMWREPQLPWLKRCESSYSGLKGVD